MPTQGIDADPAACKAAAGDLFQSIENLRKSVDQVLMASEEVRKGFTGAAATQYQKAAADWQDEAVQVNNKLDEFTRTVEDSTQKILNMDEDDFIGGGGYSNGQNTYTDNAAYTNL
ncbi:WXG100 family type VII secretion target [Nocardia sp. NPDC019395]|uniref:WXG100 family type VII secretion target n=1 Tax=Nocardia sp. NPDC019395 TaxID=3154686 RepID=UPI0033E5CE78